MNLFRLTIVFSTVAATTVWFDMLEPSALPSPVLQPVSSLEAPAVKLADVDGRAKLVAAKINLAEQVAVANDIRCNVECVLTLELIRLPYELGDTEYDRALSTVDGLATELKDNERLTQELIELAVSTSGNKRHLIIATFMLLEPSKRIALGLALAESPYREQRLDGIQILTNPSTIDSSVVQMLVALLVAEQDHYVRSSAIQALNQPDRFSGDQAVLELLQNTITSDSNHTVRGEALMVSANLTDNLEQAFAESLDAIRYGDEEYQAFGVRTLEALIHRQITQNGLEISAQNDLEVRALVTELMNPEFDDMPIDVRYALDDLYQRFFRAGI